MKTIIVNSFMILFSISLFGQDINTTVKGNSKFAFELYKTILDEKPNENAFFSPLSISAALAMTYAGAKNETQLEISKTLHFNLDQTKMHSDFSSLLKEIAYQNGNSQLSIANSIWAQKDYNFLEDYFNLIKLKYEAGIKNVDFKNPDEREKTRIEINKWVERKTDNKIKDIIKPDILNEDSRLVLVNAIYFLGKWDIAFKKEQTKEDIFYLSQKSKSNAAFMNNTLKLKYYEDETLQTIEIPYEENKFSMMIILPKSDTEIVDIEQTFDYDAYLQIMESLQTETVELSIPKFKTTCELHLKNNLAQLGMTKSFSDSADFSGITGHEGLQIDKIIHKAFVDVTEEGTTAAAATAVIMKSKSMATAVENKVFKADHPFLFMIKETKTGSILFMGKINKPE